METLIRQIAPMEPILKHEIIASDQFVYQVKWDGVRILTGISKEKVTVRNKRGLDRSEQYPELQTLAELIKAENAILDGEVVVLREGKPSFPAVIQRDRCSTAFSIHHLLNSSPIAYMVFDLLYLNGRDLRGETFEERTAKLDKLLESQDYIHQVEQFSQGKSLFEAVRQAELEGVVAKRKDSLYLPGKQHQSWYKIKCLRSQKCLVAGFTMRGNQVNALVLAVYREGGLQYAGKAANGLNTADWQKLTEELPGREISQPPFAGPREKEFHYIKPEMAVLVEFLEWTDSLRFRHPVIKGFISASESECSI